MARQWTIMGDGSMGTACATVLARQPDTEVKIWCQFAENAEAIERDRENRRYLPGVPLDAGIRIETDFHACRSSDAYVVAVPMVHLATTLARVTKGWSPKVRPIPVVSVIKGIEQTTSRRASEIISTMLPGAEVVALTGPMHAEEIARGMPASIVSASPNLALAEMVQQSFSNDRLRLYTSTDLVGAELGGALKNVIAIAAGICDGAGFGDNAKSALLTRGLVEMVRFGLAHGAQRSTFYGLAGLGDLITTSISPHGRNRRVGERLGRGETIDQILNGMTQAAEGVFTARSVYEISTRLGLEMPLATEVYQILFEGEDIAQAVHDLMGRPLTAED